MENLIGKKFGKLLVISQEEKKRNRDTRWKCLCECGKECIIPEYYLIRRFKSCGCGKRLNLIGKRSGKLLVISFDYLGKAGDSYWKCKCDCGKEFVSRGTYLKSGQTKSCGCVRKMIGEKSLSYSGYKGISGTFYGKIKIGCTRRSRKLEFNLPIEYLWDLFVKQKGKCSITGIELGFSSNSGVSDRTASLDRIDSSKGYIKGNVQWVHKDINMMKQSHSQERFIELCKMVAENNKI